ncbi:MAG: adenylyltransferase/cytidyltransferase family protein [Deltaproteobacteria bacterium]|nr:adenylyltransferase/cytidyltransferase family protein [Deltaproteobacteria bacterium]
MNAPRPATSKILTREALVEVRQRLRSKGRKLAFTNGCFDLLHSGHIRTLEFARSRGDALVVAINADAGVRGLKGPGRPIVPEHERAEVLAALACVDYVVIFPEADPGDLIRAVVPDVLVKGGDWAEHAIVGRDTVEAAGGRVERVPPVEGRSTTNIIVKVLESDR